MKNKYKFFLVSLILITLLLSLSAVSAENLTTVAQGSVSGGVDVVTTGPMASGEKSVELSYDVPEDVVDVQYAGLFVNVYSGSANTNYGAQSNISMTSNGETSQIASENLVSTEGSADGTVYTINDHTTKCYSDYQMIYNITNQVQSAAGQLKINVTNTAIEGYEFDGRIKLIGLVFAYNDGDNDKFDYWVDSGQSWINSATGTAKASFDVGDTAPGYLSATLHNVALSSTDGTYTLNKKGELIEMESSSSSMYIYHKWSIPQGNLTKKINNLTYNSTGGSFKNVLSVLTLANLKTIFVSPDGTGSGASIDDPTTLSKAVANLTSYSTIYMLDGTYEATKDNFFSIKANNTSIMALNPGNVIITGNDNYRPMRIYNSSVTLNGLTFTHGKGTGGLLYVEAGGNGSYIVNCIFKDTNGGTGAGGALYITGINVVVENCKFINSTTNSTTGGGALYVTSSNVTVTDCEFINNTALRDGGAIRWNGAYGILANSNFTNGNASNGAGVSWKGDLGNITNCNFINNVLDSPYNSSKPNHVGGAVFWIGKYGIIDNCKFINNSAYRYAADLGGGAVYWGSSSTDSTNGTVMNSIFEGNHADKDGGAIFWHLSSEGRIINCTFNNNTAGNDGGAIFWRGDNSHIYLSNFTDNHANNNSGAILVQGGVTTYLDVASCNFKNNTADALDYTIVNKGHLSLDNNTIDFDKAIYDDGVIVSSIMVAAVVNETDPDYNVYHALIGEDVEILVYIFDDQINLINGEGLSLSIGDDTITEFELLDDAGYKAVYKVENEETYNVVPVYSDATPIPGTIVVGSATSSASVYIVSEYENVTYAGTTNLLQVYLSNNGSLATTYNVDLFVDGVNKSTQEIGLAIGASEVLNFTDDTIRPVNASTVLGNDNEIVNYTVIVSDKESGEVLDEFTILPAVLYNGNFGKDLAYPAENITYFDTITVNGGMLIDTLDTYSTGGASGRTDVWNISSKLPSDAEIVNAFLYVAYNWDKTEGTIPEWTTSFNEETIAPVASYRDQGNLGKYGKYGYGLVVYDVSNLTSTERNKFSLGKVADMTAVYPSTLIVFYNVSSANTAKTIYMYNGADLLANTNNTAGRTVASNSVLAVENPQNLRSAKLYVFAASSQVNESNLVVNGQTYLNVWNGTSNSYDNYVVDITPSLTENNEVSFVATGKTILALQQFVLVEEAVPSVNAIISQEYNGACYAGTNNTLKVSLTNDGLFDETYVVDFYVDGSKVNSSEVDLAIGESCLFLLTDDTIREINESTVNGAEDAQTVNYTVIISDKDSGAVLVEKTLLPTVWYDGYLGKDYAYPAENITYFDTITINGDIVIDIKNDSSYCNGASSGRTDTWTLENDGTFVKALVYVAYNWDKTDGTVPEWNTTFNDNKVTPVASYRDQSNLGGASAKYGYGLIVYDVSEFIQNGENIFVLNKTSGLTAVYPSALVAFTNVTDSDEIKTIYMFNGADLLTNGNNTAGRTVASNSVLAIDSFDDISGARLHVFAASANVGDGNLIVNDEEFSNVWTGGSNSVEDYVVDIASSIKEENEVSFIATGTTIVALQQFVVVVENALPSVSVAIGSEYNGACYAGTNNTLAVKLTNDGLVDSIYRVELYADGVKVADAEADLAIGENASLLLTDDTIRPITADTVNGANNAKVNYTVVVYDNATGDILAETTITPTLWYNGNLGKDFAYPAENITLFDTISVNGGVIIDTLDDSTYLGAKTTNRTDVWTINLDEAQFVDAFVYVAYNWDKTNGTMPVWNTTFNGVTVTPVASYRDQSNLGTYGKYGYGLIVYDVTDLIQIGENTFELIKENGMTAVYPSTLVALYDVSESDVVTTLYMFNGADLLANTNNTAGRIVASNSVLESIELDDMLNAELYVFAASAQAGEGNLIVNGEEFTNVWSGSTNSTDSYIVDLTDSIKESNTVSFVATGSTILALEQFVIVEQYVPYAKVSVSSEYTNVAFAGTDNVLKVNVTSYANDAITYVVDLYADGVKVGSTEIELEAGASAEVLLTDDTIRPVTADTVNGANNAKVNYTVTVSDKATGEVLGETTINPSVLYNGNLGKDLAYPAENITLFNTITVNGGVIINTLDDSTYLGAKTTNRTDAWTLNLDDGSQFINAYVYVAYNWDKTNGTMPVWNTTFNGATVTPVASYRDQSNMGTYGKYGYGLIVYDVTDLIQIGENTFELIKENGMTAVYPSTLVALYNVSESNVERTLYMFNGADLLSNANNFAGRTVASNSVLALNDIENITGAELYVIAASSQAGEGNLIVNGEEFINVWNGTSNSVDNYVVDLSSSIKESNTVSFVATGSTIVALEQFVIVEKYVPYTLLNASSEYNGVAFAGTDNVLKVNVKNGADDALTYVVDLYADGVKVDSAEIELDGGAAGELLLTDDTIRPVTADTVNGASNAKVNYTVTVSDKATGDVLAETTITPAVLYNGNLGKDLAYPAENITLFDTISVNGGVIIDTLDDSTYLGAKTTNRTDVWTINLDEAQFVDAFVYVAYNWDKTNGTMSVWNTTFNGVAVAPVASYRDQSNMGTYGKYGYGLIIYDVTDLIQIGENTFELIKENGMTAVYPSTLVALYNVSESNVERTLYMFNGADLLSNANNFAGRTVASNSALDLDDIEGLTGAELYVFAASGQTGEGNLIVNGKEFANVWNGSSNSVDAYIVDLTDSIKESNTVSFVATGSTIVALEQFIILEKYVPYAKVSVSPEYNGACYAGTNNTLKVNVTNGANDTATYVVDLYADGVKVGSAEVKLAAGATGELLLTDDTIRPVTKDTVNGASNAKVNYTVTATDKATGEVLGEATITPTVWYNGYLGKDLAYPAENITLFDKITVNGGVIIDTMNDSTYLGAKTTNRTDVWNINLDDAQFVNAFVYLAYNWDKTAGTMPVLNTTFNGVAVAPVASYRDQSNMGTYGKYGYGLLIYDVTDLIANGNNTFVLNKEYDMTAIYPSTLVALYNTTESRVLTTVYMFNGADLLANSYNNAGRTVASNSTLGVELVDDMLGAELYVFAASGQSGEGNLIVNGKEFANVWNGSSNSVDAYVVDLTDSIKESNTVSFVATGSTIVALEQFVIVESVAPKTSADLQKLIDEAKEGATIDLGNDTYADIANVNITKDLTITGGVISGKEGEAIFVVPAKSAGGPDEVNITDVDFKVNNGNTIVKATADNGTSPTSIDTPAININNNTIDLANDNVVPESVTILELDSERGSLAPTSEIAIKGNDIASGVNPFEFEVTSVSKDNGDVVVDNGGNIPERTLTQIQYNDMNTVAVNQKIEGRAGKYFYVNLTDINGKPLANKTVQIGFNGAIYNRTTNETGGVKLQINLGYKGTYTFAVSYLGDDNYNGSFVVAKIVVSTQKTKLTTAKKTYKASAKTKTLTATLKDASGHVISGKKVTFTVNGKSYSATTNSKGVATVKVSLSTKKTYSFTAKYAGDNMYTASSVSGKVTIK